MMGRIGRSVGRWFDRRLKLAKFVRHALNHVFPDHWSFMLGEIALYCFVILVITGAFLAMFFDPSDKEQIYHGSYYALNGVKMSAAYQSVLRLSFDVPAGLFIRQIHHWAADLFICAIVVHQARIFFTAAYRRPREINWIIGLTLLALALANGYFGYSLPDDLLSGEGLRIGYAILISFPVIGPYLAFLLFGGIVPTEAISHRFYAFHIFLVPALIAALIGVHLFIIWRQMHTNLPGPKRTDDTIVGSRLWPSYTMKSIGLFFLLFAVLAFLGGFVQIDPIWIYGPYNPVGAMPGAQPDWYLGWIEGAMRLFPAVNLRYAGYWLIPEVFFPALLFPLLLFGVLYVYPFLEQIVTFDREQHNVLKLPRMQPVNTAIGCGVFMLLLVLYCAGGDDVIAVAIGGSVNEIRRILRILFFVAPPVIAAISYLLCKRSQRKHSPAVT